MANFFHIVDQFSKKASALRAEFDAKFADPKQTHSERFVWDYWHVPNQYSLLRTPAYHYFSEKLYSEFHHELVHWGRKNLGCWDISPPWLSCYIDGCHQNFHSDVPHGAWAFVFSLSPEKASYKGGETLIFKPEVLNYWQNFATSSDREADSFIKKIPAKFNRLTIFDPRLPHGVSELRGSRDPREGRLVLHGWWTQPKTYLDGYLSEKIVEKNLNIAAEKVSLLVTELESDAQVIAVQGTLAVGIQVKPNGQVAKVQLMTNSLVEADGREPKVLTQGIQKIYKQLVFPKAKGPTWITAPLIFGV